MFVNYTSKKQLFNKEWFAKFDDDKLPDIISPRILDNNWISNKSYLPANANQNQIGGEISKKNVMAFLWRKVNLSLS